MRNPTGFGQLFAETPPRWGLRGDPQLWAELAHAFDAQALPTHKAELIVSLQDAFERACGVPIDHPHAVFVQRFARGGMSSGQVSPSFWNENLLRLLCARYTRLRRALRESQ